MLFWVLGIFFAAAIAMAIAFLIQNRHVHFEKAAIALQALATTVAILFAGYWYIYERKGQPQANTALQIVGLKLSDDTVALETRFTVRNLGATLLEVGKLDVRLQAVNADSMPLPDLLKLDRNAFPDVIGRTDVYDDGVLLWPTLRWFQGGRPRRIEPGERDLRVIDFIASCKNTGMRVYFALWRPDDEQVWTDQATFGLADLCAKPVGTREVLSEGHEN